MSNPIDITDDTMASSLVPVQCASLAPPALLEREKKEKRKRRSFTSTQMLHTHRHTRAHLTYVSMDGWINSVNVRNTNGTFAFKVRYFLSGQSIQKCISTVHDSKRKNIHMQMFLFPQAELLEWLKSGSKHFQPSKKKDCTIDGEPLGEIVCLDYASNSSKPPLRKNR